MRPPSISAALVPCLLGLLAACSAAPVDLPELRPLPGLGSSFPAQARGASVIAEATVYGNARELLGLDFPGRLGLLPVALRVGQRAESEDAAATVLIEDELQPCLYLADGTALAPVPWSSVRRREPALDQRAERLALRGDALVPGWEMAEERFLFFALPSGLSLHGPRAVLRQDGHVQPLELEGALLSFDVRTAGGRERVRVGLSYDVR